MLGLGLSKSCIDAWKPCPKRLWLQFHRQDLRIFRMERDGDSGSTTRSKNDAREYPAAFSAIPEKSASNAKFAWKGTVMPHKDKKDTLLRQWKMLGMLGSQWKKASEITNDLQSKGHEVSVRTVQRDLKNLSLVFQIELNDKNPRDYGWRWMKDAHFAIPGMGTSEALAMRLVEMHLKELLPHSMLDALQGIFTHAKTRLDRESKTADWLKKVKVVQPAQPLLPPRIDEEAQDAIYKALLENRRISAIYRPIDREVAREYVLNPLGLIMRGPVSYLVASARGHENPVLFAMHRFEKAEVLHEDCIIPEGFDLDEAIARGLADFADGGEAVRLEILCCDEKASYLSETPLSSDQILEAYSEGWQKLTATVNDTWQLRWWLLSQGPEIVVLSPKAIRERIANDLKIASSYYET